MKKRFRHSKNGIYWVSGIVCFFILQFAQVQPSPRAEFTNPICQFHTQQQIVVEEPKTCHCTSTPDNILIVHYLWMPCWGNWSQCREFLWSDFQTKEKCIVGKFSRFFCPKLRRNWGFPQEMLHTLHDIYGYRGVKDCWVTRLELQWIVKRK